MARSGSSPPTGPTLWCLVCNTDLWLVETDHVTWILASDWSWQITWPKHWPLIGRDHDVWWPLASGNNNNTRIITTTIKLNPSVRRKIEMKQPFGWLANHLAVYSPSWCEHCPGADVTIVLVLTSGKHRDRGRDGGVTLAAVSCVNCNNVTSSAIYTLFEASASTFFSFTKTDILSGSG